MLCVAILMLALCPVACTRHSLVTYDLVTERLGTIPHHDETVCSGDGRHVAFRAERMVCVDGRNGPTYDEIRKRSLRVNADGSHVAYTARQSGKWVVVTDGQEGREYDAIGEGSPMLCPKGNRIAYTATKDGKWFAVIDGKEGPPYDHIGNEDRPGNEFVFSSDGKHIAYAARKGSEWLMVLDGEEGPRYGDLRKDTPVFSPDGTRFAYTAKRADKWRLVVDGQEGPAYQSVWDPVFSADWKHVAYTAERDNRAFVVRDGVEEPAAAYLYHSHFNKPVLSPDGNRLAYAIRTETGIAVVVDGKAGPWYDDVCQLRFSPDSQHIAYIGVMGRQPADRNYILVVDAEGGPRYEDMDWSMPMVFSPEGSRVACRAKKSGKWLVLVNGQEGPLYDEIRFEHPVFSPDGKRLAYAARNGKEWFMVVDGQEGPPYDEIGYDMPVFSPDGKHVAYGALKRLGSSDWAGVVVIDGQEGPEYHFFDLTPVFSADSRHLMYYAHRDSRLFEWDAGTFTRQVVVIDGQEGPGHGYIYGPAHPVQDGGVYEYLAEDTDILQRSILYRVRLVPKKTHDGHVLTGIWLSEE